SELADGDLHPALLTCPHNKDFPDGKASNEKLNWDRVKNQEKDEGIVDTYKELYKDRQLPLQTIKFDSSRTIPNLEYGIYYVRPPVCEKIHETDDNAYGNSTSIMFYLRHSSNSILFPGDMTPEGMQRVLKGGTGVEKRYTKFNREWTQAHPDSHSSSN